MNNDHCHKITTELNIGESQVRAVALLLKEDATIPFIARYRKEATGSLDEVAVTAIRDRLNQLTELENRKETILSSLEKHGHLNEELKEAVADADSLAVLEDIYLPYRPKRRTRSTIAKEKGLEPLALTLLEQKGLDPEATAASYLDDEKGVASVADALAGARDIIAEIVNEDQTARAKLRRLFTEKALIKSWVTGDEEKAVKYENYFNWEEPAPNAPSHRILAIRRGEKENFLNFSILPDEEDAVAILIGLFVTGDADDSKQVEMSVRDGYKRLLSRAMETETRLVTKERADREAIAVFAGNLRQLLMASPLGAKRILGIDPGFRTGCKVVCLDRQGKLLANDTIFPHSSAKLLDTAKSRIIHLQKKWDIEAIAVGNGTAGRETETFMKGFDFGKPVPIFSVNESGASVYSASECARVEFPDHDLTVRGAVSIGRRLMDPLSELVKIDAKSIGVGQYQHDVDQNALKASLDDVVVSCVNAVGVDVNRASAELLTYVSGLGPQLARNLVAHRNENGAFDSRAALKKVPRLGPKAFEQCAGFLRIKDGKNPLDASAVHPESYPIVRAMAADIGCSVSELMSTTQLRKKIDMGSYVTDTVGLPTIKDILAELEKPGRDPRTELEEFSFADGVEKMEDLETGMRIPGIVTNVTAFGAFVDIGVHQDGLVHISELADKFIKNPHEVVKVQMKVEVTVLEVDSDRKRIALSMRQQPGSRDKRPANQSKKISPKPPQRKKTEPKKTPFNNPFAEALQKIKN
ncbi:MAG: RNA-binding transcriptional accessory protein [Desulfobacteraceae bacterium]|nr:RNA-binding transcriptional accessory protein [Desulfobacteraceae bacterium]